MARKIHETFFLIDIKQNYLSNKCLLYEINEVGYFIWNALSKASSILEIADMIESEIEDVIDRGLMIDDVKIFLEILKQEGYIIEDGRNR